MIHNRADLVPDEQLTRYGAILLETYASGGQKSLTANDRTYVLDMVRMVDRVRIGCGETTTRFFPLDERIGLSIHNERCARAREALRDIRAPYDLRATREYVDSAADAMMRIHKGEDGVDVTTHVLFFKALHRVVNSRVGL